MALIDKETIRTEIERLLGFDKNIKTDYYIGKRDAEKEILSFLDTLQEQPVRDHHEIEVEFRGEKVTISREFYRNGEMNYSTSKQDDNAIWSTLRAWCEKKGITPFELYPKQSEQVKGPSRDQVGTKSTVEGLEDAANKFAVSYDQGTCDGIAQDCFKAGAEWQKKRDDLETADLLAIAHLQGMEQQKSKMMEEAVEKYVHELYTDEEGYHGYVSLGTEYAPGDKVRVIVIKED